MLAFLASSILLIGSCAAQLAFNDPIASTVVHAGKPFRVSWRQEGKMSLKTLGHTRLRLCIGGSVEQICLQDLGFVNVGNTSSISVRVDAHVGPSSHGQYFIRAESGPKHAHHSYSARFRTTGMKSKWNARQLAVVDAASSGGSSGGGGRSGGSSSGGSSSGRSGSSGSSGSGSGAKPAAAPARGTAGGASPPVTAGGSAASPASRGPSGSGSTCPAGSTTCNGGVIAGGSTTNSDGSSSNNISDSDDGDDGDQRSSAAMLVPSVSALAVSLLVFLLDSERLDDRHTAAIWTSRSAPDSPNPHFCFLHSHRLFSIHHTLQSHVHSFIMRASIVFALFAGSALAEGLAGLHVLELGNGNAPQAGLPVKRDGLADVHLFDLGNGNAPQAGLPVKRDGLADVHLFELGNGNKPAAGLPVKRDGLVDLHLFELGNGNKPAVGPVKRDGGLLDLHLIEVGNGNKPAAGLPFKRSVDVPSPDKVVGSAQKLIRVPVKRPA